MHRVLSLYDSKNRALSAVPKRRHEVGMYVCGPTVYQRAHIGNARPFVIFSWLKQWLEAGGRRVTFVDAAFDAGRLTSGRVS
jgi:cysteinyl-tRNA synthetase